jgi:CTP:molybdopterin cytidylyltransferase MocA
MGRPKALLEVEGRSFLSRVAATLRLGGVDDVVVVTGWHDAEIRAYVEAHAAEVGQLRIVHNARHELGQLSSVLAALAAVDRPGVGAILVTLVDLPLVGHTTVTALLQAWRASGAPVVRPTWHDRHGHPVIFARSVFDELRHAPPDQGARSVVHRLGAAVLDIAVEDEGTVVDIDDPRDYARLLGSLL